MRRLKQRIPPPGENTYAVVDNPFGSPDDKGRPVRPQPQRPEGNTKIFRQMWHDLHYYAQWYAEDPTPDDIAEAERWMAEFMKRFPKSCACKRGWSSILKKCPPPLAEGRSAFFWWTIAAHDCVNRKLGKKIWSACKT